MRCKNKYPDGLNQILHPFFCLVLEIGVAGSKYFIHQQNIGTCRCSHRKHQPGGHTRGIGSNRKLQEVAQLGEFFDVTDTLLDFPHADAHQHAHPNNIFITGELRIHSGPQFQNGGDAPFSDNFTCGRSIDASHCAQHRAFSGAIVANQRHRIALFQGERNIFQRSHNADMAGLAFNAATRTDADNLIPQGHAADIVNRILNRYILKFQLRHIQIQNAIRLCFLLNSQTAPIHPTTSISKFT
ncbi:hypothetical protein D3C78_1061350 [compost metagenome]